MDKNGRILFSFFGNNITQKILIITAFLTFGLADSYTSATMMELKGVQMESNIVIENVFINFGFWGVIGIKLMYTAIVLFLIYMLQLIKNEKIYWKVNGFLLITSIFGGLAAIANIKAMEGIYYIDPIIFSVIYFMFMILFIIIGDIIDKRKF